MKHARSFKIGFSRLLNQSVYHRALMAAKHKIVTRHYSDDHFIVGMTNSAPLRIPVGQREVIAFRRV